MWNSEKATACWDTRQQVPTQLDNGMLQVKQATAVLVLHRCHTAGLHVMHCTTKS